MNVTDKIWELNKLIKQSNSKPQKRLMTIIKYKLIKNAEAEGYNITTTYNDLQTTFHLGWQGVEIIHTKIPNDILNDIENNNAIKEDKLNAEIDSVLGINTETDPTTSFINDTLRELDLGMRD